MNAGTPDARPVMSFSDVQHATCQVTACPPARLQVPAAARVHHRRHALCVQGGAHQGHWHRGGHGARLAHAPGRRRCRGWGSSRAGCHEQGQPVLLGSRVGVAAGPWPAGQAIMPWRHATACGPCDRVWGQPRPHELQSLTTTPLQPLAAIGSSPPRMLRDRFLSVLCTHRQEGFCDAGTSITASRT